MTKKTKIDYIKTANKVIKDIFDELKEGLIGVDLSKVKLYEGAYYEIDICYSAINGNHKDVINHCLEVMNRRSKDHDLGEYSIKFEDDNLDAKVKIGVEIENTTEEVDNDFMDPIDIVKLYKKLWPHNKQKILIEIKSDILESIPLIATETEALNLVENLIDYFGLDFRKGETEKCIK